MERVISQAEQLSAIIKTMRKDQGLGQAEAASLLALTQGRYSQLENDIGKLTLERALVLLRQLGLELVVRERPASTSPMGDAIKATPRVGEAIKAWPRMGPLTPQKGAAQAAAKPAAPAQPKQKALPPGQRKPGKGAW
ncbi:helix-turn-helix domain-containing protein [Aquabacterium sp. NJ1]|uniref:helix-turn-helix domain-containing protein n=1 Tax=Aquabacterium sp. NJ1 TaxID=1538295 RepID=UPI00068DF00E|nr:helix-turn-helix domain-containing protein [Aquabacterium sp. NJ1]